MTKDQLRALELEAEVDRALRKKREEHSRPKDRKALFLGLAFVIFQGRSLARRLGHDSVFRQFQLEDAMRSLKSLRDLRNARAVADRHVRLIESMRHRATLLGKADPDKEALKLSAFRVQTIASSEVFSVASDARMDAALDVQRRIGVQLYKRWNAEADACDQCASKDGETVLLQESFSGGVSPGSVHPSCRCWADILEDPNK